MANASRRRRPKDNAVPDYVPSAAGAFPSGAPPSIKKQTANPHVPTKDSQTQHPSMAAETIAKRATEDEYSIDASSTKRQKTAASLAGVTAYESPSHKRKVQDMSAIDPLSTKPTKVTKFSSQVLPKRKAGTSIASDRASSKKVKAGSENVLKRSAADFSITEYFDPTEDIPTKRSDATPKSLDKPKGGEGTTAKSPSTKRDAPISLEVLANTEEAAKAAASTAASTATSTAVPTDEDAYPLPADSPCKFVAALCFEPNQLS